MLSKINNKMLLFVLLFGILAFCFVGCVTIDDKKDLPVYSQYYVTEYYASQYFVNSVNHRGYYTAPENTLSAYRESFENGFSMVECDVQFTLDNKPVLLHDDTIDRTSNGTGRIDSLTLEEVRALDFGGWKSEKYIGEKIPTFEEFILLCRNLSLHPYIEIKYDLTNEQAHTLVRIVMRFGMLKNVTWISFNINLLQAVLEIDSSARIGYLVGPINEEQHVSDFKKLCTSSNSVFLDCYYSDINSHVIELCINEAIPLEVWTVDSEEDILNLDPYISGITSNSLIAGKILQERG